jgi:hypothetical protein
MYVFILTKKCWATFLAIFSKTHLVTLSGWVNIAFAHCKQSLDNVNQVRLNTELDFLFLTLMSEIQFSLLFLGTLGGIRPHDPQVYIQFSKSNTYVLANLCRAAWICWIRHEMSYDKNRIDPIFCLSWCTTSLGLAWMQGCQMVSFLTKNPNLGKFWRALKWKRLAYLMANWILGGNFAFLIYVCQTV